MKRTLFIIISLVTVSLLYLHCDKYPIEYKLKDFRSIYIKKPDHALNFAKRSADFWKKTYDKKKWRFFYSSFT